MARRKMSSVATCSVGRSSNIFVYVKTVFCYNKFRLLPAMWVKSNALATQSVWAILSSHRPRCLNIVILHLNEIGNCARIVVRNWHHENSGFNRERKKPFDRRNHCKAVWSSNNLYEISTVYCTISPRYWSVVFISSHSDRSEAKWFWRVSFQQRSTITLETLCPCTILTKGVSQFFVIIILAGNIILQISMYTMCE